MAAILVIDDDKNIQKSFTQLFSSEHEVFNGYNGKEGLDIFSSREVDLVFLDYRMPGEDGLAILKSLKKLDPGVPVIMITAHGNFETIIEATSLGAYDYIEKPLDIDKISILAKRAVESRKLSKYVNTIRSENIRNYELKKIIGNSVLMQDVFKSVGRLVNNDVVVHITGESGTGKELLARALHFNGNRKNEPFIAVNCSGLTESLLDNELFGHEPQAFTGAVSLKIGKFEAAGEGTIFLDEIGDMPLQIQTKLLRVLQEKEYQRMGGLKNIKLKARVITATNRNLHDEVKTGRFREDLYYRINVAKIVIPPLRDRKEDIPVLADFFLKNASYKLNKIFTSIASDLMSEFTAYDWPGNVRELENLLTSICINAQGPSLSLHDMQVRLVSMPPLNLLEKAVNYFCNEHRTSDNLLPLLYDKLEKIMIDRIGREQNFNKSAMAKILGISRVTLAKKMNLPEETKESGDT